MRINSRIALTGPVTRVPYYIVLAAVICAACLSVYLLFERILWKQEVEGVAVTLGSVHAKQAYDRGETRLLTAVDVDKSVPTGQSVGTLEVWTWPKHAIPFFPGPSNTAGDAFVHGWNLRMQHLCTQENEPRNEPDKDSSHEQLPARSDELSE